MKPDEIYDQTFLSRLRPHISDVHRFLHAVYVDPEGREEWSTRQSLRLAECFDLADRNGLIDADFLRRVTSPDRAQFWGKINELTAARHFNKEGISLSFDPPGRNRRIGEFVIDLPTPVFVEVKTMHPRSQDNAQSRYLDIICGEIRQIDCPLWLTITLDATPTQDFRRGPLRDFVAREFPAELADLRVPLSKTYVDDRSGLRVSLILSGSLQEGPMDASPLIGPLEITNDQYVRSTLESAAEQLPADQPCLVILFEELTFPLRPKTLLNALYGSLSAVIGPPGTDAVWTRLDDGFLRPGQHTRVSTVGYFDTPSERNHPDPELQLYFHPEPRITIDASELLPVSSKHLIPKIVKDNGTKAWELKQPHDQFV